MQLVAGGCLVAIIFGLGLAAAANKLDTSFHSIYELRAFTTVPILASIPLIEAPADTRRKIARTCALAVLAGVVLVIVGIAAFRYGQAGDGITRTLLRIG
jgi:hypothetical protein